MDTLANINNYWGYWAEPLTILGFTIGALAFTVVLLWSFYWKGRALWRAAKNDNRKWFIALLVINTLGILEILYIYVFGKKKHQ